MSSALVHLLVCVWPSVLTFSGGKEMRPVKPWDLLKKDNWTMEEVRDARLKICGECPELNLIRQCKVCHCFVDAKAWLENAYCPIRKW